MLSSLVTLLTWTVVLFVATALGLLAFNKERGLKLLQHRVDMLPQVMLVRYAGLGALALAAALFNVPHLLFAMLLAFAVTGLGDAFIYRRAGHPFWMHLGIGAVAGLGAILALFSLA